MWSDGHLQPKKRVKPHRSHRYNGLQWTVPDNMKDPKPPSCEVWLGPLNSLTMKSPRGTHNWAHNASIFYSCSCSSCRHHESPSYLLSRPLRLVAAVRRPFLAESKCSLRWHESQHKLLNIMGMEYISILNQNPHRGVSENELYSLKWPLC